MFSWSIQTRQNKGMLWYTIAGIIVLSLIIWGFIEGIYALSIATILLVGVYILIENNAPDVTYIEINNDGILIGEDFYEYPKIELFGIVYNKKNPRYLRIRLKGHGIKTIDIDFDQSIPASEVRVFLSQFIPEADRAELSLSETIIQLLKM